MKNFGVEGWFFRMNRAVNKGPAATFRGERLRQVPGRRC